MLSFKLTKVTTINSTQIVRMYQLMCEYYDNVHENQFRNDLFKKDYVGIMNSEDQRIFGFTTIKVNPVKITGVNIIYSGDTIIDRPFWGKNNLTAGWIKAIGQICSTKTKEPWLWVLISKGHRTYMYLPIYFGQYFPAIDSKKGKALESLVIKTAEKMFGDNWNAEKGILRFNTSMGNLKNDLIEDTLQSSNKHAQFFLKKNPGFYKGEELVCGTWLNDENLHPRIKKYFNEGFNEGLKHE
jgi:hypothetical protein